MKKIFLVVSCCLFMLSLAGCGGPSPDTGVTILDARKAIDTPRPFDISEIAQSIEYIPLDASVPVGEISVLEGLRPAAEGFYVIPANQMSPVQHFDRAGKFISAIGRIGRGPGETIFIQGIVANDTTGEEYIDGVTDIVGLDATGTEFARMKSAINWGMAWYRDQLLMLPVPNLFDENAYTGDSLAFIDIFDRNLKPVGSISGPNLGPFLGLSTNPPEGYVAPGSPPFLSDTGERLLVKQGRGDTIYQYSAGAIRPVYVLRLGNHTPPAEVFGLDHPVQWNERYFTVTNLWEGDRYVIVSVSNLVQESMRSLIFDRRDFSSGFMATGGIDGNREGLFAGGIKFTPMYVRENRLVGYMNALDIFDNAAAITNPKLKEIAAATKEDSNPVAVVVELKK